MTHLVHDVMGHVAMQGPIAGGIGDELNRAGCSHRNQRGYLRPPRRLWNHAAIGLGNPELMPMQVDRMVVHGASGCRCGSARAGRCARPAVRCRGKLGALIVSTLKSVISLGVGPIGARGRCATHAGAGRNPGRFAAPLGLRGWMMNRPVMPSPICVISSWWEWYMCVPDWRSVNSYLNVSPGGMGALGQPADAVHAVGGRRMPCQ